MEKYSHVAIIHKTGDHYTVLKGSLIYVCHGTTPHGDFLRTRRIATCLRVQLHDQEERTEV